jgi:NAD(P)-dependent dehydrogenase (short-subunit alcohol dehydrogenase family)
MNEYMLKGHVALITGAGSGLGEATARALATAGCNVACADIDEIAVVRVCDEIKEQNIMALARHCDVSDAASVAATVQAVYEQFGRLDIVVNCAAVDYTYSVEELSVEQWDRVVGINIVNIGSTAGLRAWANASVYHATKWGIIGFSRGLGVEGREAGIRVTTIVPGGMRTHFFDRFKEQGIPMPDPEKLQDPAVVADAIVYAVQVPPQSAVQELMITPVNETSWP